MALTNIEKQARYRERHLGADGEKVRVGLILGTTKAKMIRRARRQGYTIIPLVEKIVESAERRDTSKLTGKALKVYLDDELMRHQEVLARGELL
jgi:hypothetical protein